MLTFPLHYLFWCRGVIVRDRIDTERVERRCKNGLTDNLKHKARKPWKKLDIRWTRSSNFWESMFELKRREVHIYYCHPSALTLCATSWSVAVLDLRREIEKNIGLRIRRCFPWATSGEGIIRLYTSGGFSITDSLLIVIHFPIIVGYA